jgi:hypothetical protein
VATEGRRAAALDRAHRLELAEAHMAAVGADAADRRSRQPGPCLQWHDHHAEQQRDGIEVNRLIGIFERQGPRRDHEAGADQGDAGSVDAQARNSANRECKIASDKYDAGRNAPPRQFGRRPETERAPARRRWLSRPLTLPSTAFLCRRPVDSRGRPVKSQSARLHRA